MWALDEFLTRAGHFQQTIVLYVLLQVSGDESLTDNGVPYLLVLVLARTEFLQVLVLVRNDLVVSRPVMKSMT